MEERIEDELVCSGCYVGVFELLPSGCRCVDFFFFNDAGTTEIYTVSLHETETV